jgi:hypothetical protein
VSAPTEKPETRYLEGRELDEASTRMIEHYDDVDWLIPVGAHPDYVSGVFRSSSGQAWGVALVEIPERARPSRTQIDRKQIRDDLQDPARQNRYALIGAAMFAD